MDINTFVAIGGYAIAGGLAIFGVANKAWRQRRTEDDGVTQNLISNLQATVTLQEKTIGDLRTTLNQTTKEMHQMQGRNSVLEGLFNGSENSIMAFLKQAPELMTIARQNNAIGTNTEKQIGELTKAIGDLVAELRAEREVVPAV